MKIVHVITCLNTGGAEMMLQKLIIESSHTEDEHVVISLMDEGTLGSEIKKHVKLYSIGMDPGAISLFALYKLFRIIKQENPNVIQGWMYHANIAALFVNIILNRILVWNIRQSLVDIKYEKKLTRLLINLSSFCSRFVNKIIFNSHISLSQHTAFGFNQSNTLVIPNGFDLTSFQLASDENLYAFKKECKIPIESKIIGHVARYHPMKNHIGFIKEITKLLLGNRNLFCVMVGKGVDGNNRELISLIEGSKCKDQFILLGERSDLSKIYGCFDFTVNSSLWGEAFPNVIGESMACGTPCIVSDVGDSARIVAEFGFVYPPSQSNNLILRLQQALDVSSTDYNELAFSCRRHISNNYSINAVYGKYANLYNNLISNNV